MGVLDHALGAAAPARDRDLRRRPADDDAGEPGRVARRALALAGSLWLLVGPSLHPLWSSTIHVATLHNQTITSLLWIGYFYGTGAVATYLVGTLHGLLSRRTVIEDTPVIQERPVERRERVTTHA